LRRGADTAATQKPRLDSAVLWYDAVNPSGWSIAIDLYDLHAAIEAAFGADAMGDMIFATVYALHQMLQRQGVVGAAPVSPGLRDFSLR